MTTTKPWYLSRTIWASAVTIAVSVGGVLGMPTTGLDGSAITDTLLQAIAAITGIITLVGRISATTAIGKKG